MKQHKFKVKLVGQAGSEVAALKPPFDVIEVFNRKGRVPVKGTINGFPFRSSLMNMGDGHMMVVNAQLRAGANCKGGDTVAVLMELDEDKRTVEVPRYLKKIIDADPKAKEVWPKLSFSAGDRGREKRGNSGETHCRHDGDAPQEAAPVNCHPERSSCFASRSSRVVEGPLLCNGAAGFLAHGPCTDAHRTVEM